MCLIFLAIIISEMLCIDEQIVKDYVSKNIGNIIDKENHIGKGCSADIYKFEIGEHKFVLKKFFDMKRCRKEIENLKKIKKFEVSVVPRIYILDYSRAIVVMDRLGEDLERWIEKEQKDKYTMKSIVQKIFDGIFMLHKAKLVHGDIHLGNIMAREGDVFFVDFGDSFFSRDFTIDLLRLQHKVLSRIEGWRVFAKESSLKNPEAFKVIEKIYDDPGIALLFNFTSRFNAPGMQYILYRALGFLTNLTALMNDYSAKIFSDQ